MKKRSKQKYVHQQYHNNVYEFNVVEFINQLNQKPRINVYETAAANGVMSMKHSVGR